MPGNDDDLTDLVLAAFKEALAEERMDIAEHLLVTLEKLGKGSDKGDEEAFGTQVAETYKLISKRAKPACEQ